MLGKEKIEIADGKVEHRPSLSLRLA